MNRSSTSALISKKGIFTRRTAVHWITSKLPHSNAFTNCIDKRVQSSMSDASHAPDKLAGDTLMLNLIKGLHLGYISLFVCVFSQDHNHRHFVKNNYGFPGPLYYA